jgi:Zn finger protein HypA/HybF involved in hydrogenase expression
MDTPPVQPCEFCGHPFDQDALGRHGCPNCEGDGLSDETDDQAEYRKA